MNTSAFHTTHWSVVLAAKGDDTKARVALRELCESYRDPILRHIRRAVATDAKRRYGGRDAEDLTHDFLALLLEGDMFGRLERRGIRFRAYLLGAVRHFLSNVRQRESSGRRGGGVVHVPISPEYPQIEEEKMFDRDWARTTINRAVDSLGDSRKTQTLLPWLTRELTAEHRVRLVSELGMGETAIKVALYRLRRKIRKHVREQIARTVESETEIDSELAYLVKALAVETP